MVFKQKITHDSSALSGVTEHGLKRSLSWLDTFTLGFGAIIGWSWIILVAELMDRAGSLGSIIATAVGGGLIIVIGLLYGELASAMPKVGGEHAYSLRALGRTPSFFCTWAIAFAYLAVVGLEAVALPDVLSNIFTSLKVVPLYEVEGWTIYAPQLVIGLGSAVLFAVINIIGIRLAAIIQTIVVALIIAAGVSLFLGAGLKGDSANTVPLFAGAAVSGILGALAFVPFMMVGFDVIPQAAEEINLNPRKIGILIILSLVMAVLWYILIQISVAFLLAPENRPGGSLATINAAEAAYGPTGGLLLMLGGAAGILTSWNAFLIGGSRAIFSLGASGMLPEWLGRSHSRYKTPANAIIFVTLFGMIAAFFGRPAVVWFVNAGGFALMISFFFVSLSFIRLRQREPLMPRPYKAPFGSIVGPVGLLASLGMGFLYLPGQPAALLIHEWAMVFIWFALGYAGYLWASR